jgi:hypothetical protein
MGGIIFYAAAAFNASLRARFASAVLVGSSVDYTPSPSIFHRLIPLLPFASKILPAFPLGALKYIFAPLAGVPPPPPKHLPPPPSRSLPLGRVRAPPVRRFQRQTRVRPTALGEF